MAHMPLRAAQGKPRTAGADGDSRCGMQIAWIRIHYKFVMPAWPCAARPLRAGRGRAGAAGCDARAVEHGMAVFA